MCLYSGHPCGQLKFKDLLLKQEEEMDIGGQQAISATIFLVSKSSASILPSTAPPPKKGKRLCPLTPFSLQNLGQMLTEAFFCPVTHT